MSDMISYLYGVGATQIRVLDTGRGSDTVLFVHGVGARADRWRTNMDALAELGFRCLAIDLPGHGFSYKGANFRYTVPSYSRLIADFFQEFNIPRGHLIGTSLGGHIVGTLAVEHPWLVRSLTLIGTTGMFPIGLEARSRIADRIADLSREGIARKLQSVIFDADQVSDRLIEAEWRINNSPGAQTSFDALAAYFRSDLDKDAVGERLAASAGKYPMQLIWGESDRSIPIDIGRQVEQLLKVPLRCISDTAHAPYWERPDVFNGIMRDFLQTLR